MKLISRIKCNVEDIIGKGLVSFACRFTKGEKQSLLIKKGLRLMVDPNGNLEIPEGVTYIGDYAFSRCSNLTEITIPEGVTSIGTGAFSECTSLTTINIPEGVTRISVGAFSGCTSLTEITIPEGVTSIGDYAFARCSNLTEITIPEGVTSIGAGALSECTSLTTINIQDNCTIVVPEGYITEGGTLLIDGREILVKRNSEAKRK